MKRSPRFFIFHCCAGLAVFSHSAIAAESYANGNSVATQRDGKIVVAGYADVGGVDRFALVRYNSDGSLDTSFNSNGKVTTAVGTGTCKGQGVALQGDGKIVVVGYSFNAGGQSCFTVLRYGADGNLDTSFGDSGKVTTTVAKDSNADSVAMQSDGKIVVAGNAFIDRNNNDFGIVRYNANGTLDTTFNGTGKATADFGAHDLGHSVAVHGDGRMVVAGYSTNESKKQCALACLKANGNLDTSFNGTGKVTTNFGGEGDAEGQGVATQSDGRTVVVGYATVGGVQQFAIARYNTDGALDTSFGGTGRVLTAVGISGSNATGVALQKDGKIVVAGYAVNNSGRVYDFACLRYNADGSLDQSFGDHGKVTTDVGDGKASSLAVQDNKIIVAGSAYDGDNNEFAVVRYNASGKLDTSFNSAGSVLTAVGSKPPEAEEDSTPRVSMAVISDPDGYTNVRDYDGKVLAKVKKGEHFIAAKPSGPPQSPASRKSQHDDPKWSVCLKSGITGFVDKSRIHLLPDEPLMKLNHDARKKEWRKFQSAGMPKGTRPPLRPRVAALTILKFWRRRVTVIRRRSRSFSLSRIPWMAPQPRAISRTRRQFFTSSGTRLFRILCAGCQLADQVGVRGTVMGGLSEEEFANGADVNYLQRYFPETTKLLFRGEIVDWTSPDERYSIRKTFTDPLDLAESKVSHAELIEKATGQTLCDLTNADIGVGGAREGSVLWSPDSKRFAYVASDLSHAGRLFSKTAVPPQKTQTTVYQNSDKSFTKIDLPLDQPPGKENDPDIKGAVMGHEFVTPVRWADANTLILERHDYYERLMPPSGSVHGFARLYEITVSFKDDGTANTSWKLREDR